MFLQHFQHLSLSHTDIFWFINKPGSERVLIHNRRGSCWLTGSLTPDLSQLDCGWKQHLVQALPFSVFTCCRERCSLTQVHVIGSRTKCSCKSGVIRSQRVHFPFDSLQIPFLRCFLKKRCVTGVCVWAVI